MSKLSSKIRLQTAFMLARDIQTFRAGDTARFDRMVDGHGKGIINLETAKKNIMVICQIIRDEFPVTSRMLMEWVKDK